MTAEDESEAEISKDEFFRRIAGLADDMIRVYGREFAMGALVLAARFIAEGKEFHREDAPADPSVKP
jgi:hypothetical protein